MPTRAVVGWVAGRSACSSCAAFESVAEFTFKGDQGCLEQFPPRHDDNIEPWRELVATEDFSYQTLRSVPRDGATQLAEVVFCLLLVLWLFRGHLVPSLGPFGLFIFAIALGYADGEKGRKALGQLVSRTQGKLDKQVHYLIELVNGQYCLTPTASR